MKILRELREKRGLTLEQVADALGLRNQYVSNYELGKRRPDYDTLVRFADFYGVSVDYILGREEKTPAPVSGSGQYPHGYDLLTPEQKEIVDRLISDLAKNRQSAD